VTEDATHPAPRVSGFVVKCAIAALGKRNIATRPLLHRASLSEHAFVNPRYRISAIGQIKFLEYAAETMDDVAFGLHLAERSDPREAGLLFYVVSAARNLGEAMALYARYNRIVNESAQVKIARQTASVIVEVSFVGFHDIA
jgi:predicted deacetylase